MTCTHLKWVDHCQNVRTAADRNIQVIDVERSTWFHHTQYVGFNSYVSLADDPCVVLCLWECTINETMPQNGSTMRASLLLSSKIDFVHIISWQPVQISAPTHAHVVLTEHNMLWLVCEVPASCLMLSWVYTSQQHWSLWTVVVEGLKV